jgi:hypothetical protein
MARTDNQPAILSWNYGKSVSLYGTQALDSINLLGSVQPDPEQASLSDDSHFNSQIVQNPGSSMASLNSNAQFKIERLRDSYTQFVRNETERVLLCEEDLSVNVLQILEIAGWSSNVKIDQFLVSMQIPILQVHMAGPRKGRWIELFVARALCCQLLPEFVEALDILVQERSIILKSFQLLPLPDDAVRKIIVPSKAKPNSIRFNPTRKWVNVADIMEVSGHNKTWGSTFLEKHKLRSQVELHAWAARSRSSWTDLDTAQKISNYVLPELKARLELERRQTS